MIKRAICPSIPRLGLLLCALWMVPHQGLVSATPPTYPRLVKQHPLYLNLGPDNLIAGTQLEVNYPGSRPVGPTLNSLIHFGREPVKGRGHQVIHKRVFGPVVLSNNKKVKCDSFDSAAHYHRSLFEADNMGKRLIGSEFLGKRAGLQNSPVEKTPSVEMEDLQTY